ncbi:methyl-accepting chemotaxis protein [Methylobacterium sp. ID0610]|uniref:methyl-accepting chemotaxis protein n=1 Tax=Methylobacterium carpenticola TaxID=3344827 RepID=UPI00368404B0
MSIGNVFHTVAARIVLVALAPCLAFAVIVGLVVHEHRGRQQEMERVETLVGIAAAMSGVIHEAQTERGASNLLIGSTGTQFRTELTDQRRKTDAALAALTAVTAALPDLGGDVRGRIDALASVAERLAGHRRDVDALSATATQNFGFYSGVITQGLGVIQAMSRVVTHPALAARLSAYSALLALKEEAGRERATAALAFAAGRADLGLVERMAVLAANQATYESIFRLSALPEQAASLDAAQAGAAAREVARLRRIVVETLPGEPLAFRDAPGWFGLATARINALKGVEDRLTGELVEAARATKAEAGRALAVWSAAGIATFALTALLALGLGAAIARPLVGIAGALTAIGRGESEVSLPSGGPTELRAIAAAAVDFRDSVAERRRVRAEQEAMGRSLAASQRAAMIAVADGFEAQVSRIVEAVSEAARDLQGAARTMAGTATETASQSAAVSAAAQLASSTVTAVSAATGQLDASVSEIGRQAHGSAELARTAVDEAERTGRVVEDLSRAASEIGEVAALIATIAGQTNLLALNATIEAARAGEAGRGFAVVAAEVKDLATQTARATDEITARIDRIQGSTGEAVGAIGRISGVIDRLSQVSGSIAAAVEEQGAATREIVRTLAQAAVGTGEVTGTIAGVAEAAEETGAAAAQVLTSSSDLSRQADRLAAEVGRFLATVRAA